MIVKELFKDVPIRAAHKVNWEERITGLTDHSEEVKEGYLFVVRKGRRWDGKQFIPSAIRKGAKLVLREDPVEVHLPIPQLRVANLKEVIPQILARFFAAPERSLKLLGITGTNGKTSSAYFVKELCQRVGIPAGYIGSIHYDVGVRYPSRETTPSIFKLYYLMKIAVEQGLRVLSLEVSSHALEQDRIYGLRFDGCGFTNLSWDHLDYHGDMESYFLAKKKLFTSYLKPTGRAVISLESAYGERLIQELKDLGQGQLFPVNDGFLRTKILNRTPFLLLLLSFAEKEYTVETKLIGDFQAKNLSVAIGIMLSLGVEMEAMVEKVSSLTNPPGRLELVGLKGESLILVDYAHTPHALESALTSLRPLKRGRLIVLFGCGGNRDRGKRPLMGEVAENLADVIILTSDNPRFEDPEEIIKDIKRGLKGTKPLFVWVDRRRAIEEALTMLVNGDILLIAGKGHEDYQEIKGIRSPFSDREVVQTLLEGERAKVKAKT